MDRIPNNGEYVAPEIDVIETKSQGTLCISGNQEDYSEGTWQW